MGTIRKRGRRYYAEVCINGKRKGKTHDTRKAAREWIQDAERGAIGLDAGRGTLAHLVERYIREVSRDHKGAHQEKYRLRRIVRELPDVPISRLTASDFSAWKSDKLNQISPATVRRYMTALNSVLQTALVEWQVIDRNPMAGVKKPPSSRPRSRVPSEDEIPAILEALGYVDGEPVRTQQQRIAVSFLVALETAMRAGEILSLSRETIDYRRQVATLIETKNGDRREVPLSSKAIALLRRVDPEYFPISSAVHSQLFRRAVRNAGLEDLRFHDSRAAGLMRLSRKVDVLDLARIVGQRDPRTLMIYYRETAEDIAKKLG